MRARTPVRLLALLALVVGIGLPSLPAAGQDTTRLASPPDGGRITRAVIGPDDAVVAYLATDGCSSCLEELYAVGLHQGAQPVLLSRVDGGATQVQVDYFGFSGDGTQLYFAGSRMVSGEGDHALYRVPVDGSSDAVRLSPRNDSITEVVGWTESPDGRTLVYRLRDLNNTSRGLEAVPTDGSEADSVVIASGFGLVGISNTHAIVDAGSSLERVPLTGPAGAAVQLTPDGHYVYTASLTADATRIVYEATSDLYASDNSLYSIPVGGGSATTLYQSPPNEDYIEESLQDFDVSPDSARVVYSVSASSDVNGANRIMSVPVAGPASAGVQLNGAVTGSQAFESYPWLAFTADGQRVLFEAYEDYDTDRKLVSVPVGGPASAGTVITQTAGFGSLVAVALSPDGSRVAWSEGVDYEPETVYAANSDGSGSSVTLSPAGVTAGYDVDFLPGGQVLYTGSTAGGPTSLYRVPSTGPASASETIGTGGAVIYDVTGDGAIIVYLAAQESSTVELFAYGSLPAAPSGGGGDGGGDGGGGDTTPPPDTGDVERWAGTNRYDTAAAASAATFGPGVPVAYIAVGGNFPDALAGVAAAGLQGGPILLTDTAALPSSTASELTRLQPGRIVVLGGTGAVSAAVAAQLADYTDGSVTRLFGSGRFDTAAAVSAATFAPGVTVAYIATGANFPDALAGGPAAGLHGGPVLLTLSDSLPEATADELARLQPGRIVILGGSGVVSETVRAQLANYTDGSVTRLFGSGRYDTAAAVSAATFSPGVDIVLVAVGTNFPDALAGGPAAIALGGPILLVERDSVPPATASELARLQPARIVVLGGRGVVTDEVAAALDAYIAR